MTANIYLGNYSIFDLSIKTDPDTGESGKKEYISFFRSLKKLNGDPTNIHLSPKIIPADSVPQTSCKSILKKINKGMTSEIEKVTFKVSFFGLWSGSFT